FHASLQGTACYPDGADALNLVKEAGLLQGLLSDAQYFTPLQLERAFSKQAPERGLDDFIDPELRSYSYEVRSRKPSERLFRSMLSLLGQRPIGADQVLHIGPRITQDVVPARRVGMKTRHLDRVKGPLPPTHDQVKEPPSQP